MIQLNKRQEETLAQFNPQEEKILSLSANVSSHYRTKAVIFIAD